MTKSLVDELCAAGVNVTSRTYPGTGHDKVMEASGADAAAWMAALLSGERPTSNCPP